MSRQIVTCMIRDSPLSFVRVAGLCARRRCTVESMIAGPSGTPGVSLITLVIDADQARIANVVKQLDKLIDILRVDLLSPASSAVCELLLARIGSVVDEVVRRDLDGVNRFGGTALGEGSVDVVSGRVTPTCSDRLLWSVRRRLRSPPISRLPGP